MPARWTSPRRATSSSTQRRAPSSARAPPRGEHDSGRGDDVAFLAVVTPGRRGFAERIVRTLGRVAAVDRVELGVPELDQPRGMRGQGGALLRVERVVEVRVPPGAND